MNELELKIINELKSYHKGKANAIHYRELAFHLDIEERHLRNLVSEIIKSGQACICSTSSDGYFYPVSQDEFEHAQSEDISRIKELVKKHKGRRLAWLKSKEQIEVKQLVML
jgi:hypothetical protein